MIFEDYIETIFLLLLLFSSIAFTLSKDLISAIITLISFSLAMSVMYSIMKSPDVSMTEAAIGSALTSIFPLAILSMPEIDNNKLKIENSKFAFCIMILLILIFIYLVSFMPLYGDFNAPAHNHIAAYYLSNAGEDIGIKSVVASILASYRGYDTLGETLVIFAAGLCVILILNTKNIFKQKIRITDKLITVISRFILPIIIVSAFYIQIQSENSPGGGFQAGSIMSCGFILYLIVTDSAHIMQKFLVSRFKYLSAVGMFLYLAIGILCMFLGGDFLDYYFLADNLIIGQKIGIFIIEIGIGITVFSVLSNIYVLLSNK